MKPILICLQGAAGIQWPQGNGWMTVNQGQAVFIPHDVREYALKGQARFYKAAANLRVK
jgi:mannose-6-phosphate isomerase class I